MGRCAKRQHACCKTALAVPLALPRTLGVPLLKPAVQVVRRKRRELVEAVQNEKIVASGRPLEPQLRTESRTEVNRRIDPYKIRAGAHKMVLPPEEEAKLALVRAETSGSCVCVRKTSRWTAAGRCAWCMGRNRIGTCTSRRRLMWLPLLSAASCLLHDVL